MPATSEAQRKMMGADLARLRAGQRTRTGMTEAQLREFATKRKKKPTLPTLSHALGVDHMMD